MSNHNEGDVRISAVLHRLGLPDTKREAELLSGGQSGAAVYRVQGEGDGTILKLTRADAPRHLIEQARREARFYRELAPMLPIPVPRVIELADEDEGDIAIVLAEYVPAPRIERWVEDDFLQIARQLGQLHGAFWNCSDEVPAWVERKPPISRNRLDAAIHRWAAAGNRPEHHAIITPHLPRLERLIERIPALPEQLEPLPETLSHGDCHAENYLNDDRGEFLLADWQQVRRGPGADDLSFFFQRAFAAIERAVPLGAMVRVYTETLNADFGVTVSSAQIERQLYLSEIRGWLIDWPEYLGFLPVSSVGRILARIDWLGALLDGELL